MDVEKTIEFLLENQARLQAMVGGSVERARDDAARTKEEMTSIRQILQETAFIQREQARVLVRLESNIGDLAAAQKDLAAAQQVTEVKLQALIEALGPGTNGSNGKKQ